MPSRAASNEPQAATAEIRIAVAQTSPRWGEPGANRAEIEALLDGAPPFDLVVLPELCLSGYQFRAREELRELADEIPGPSSAWLEGLARRHDAIVVAGLAERTKDALYNSAAAVGPRGLILHYRKIHLFHRETEVFTPGDLGFRVALAETSRVRVRLGVMVCFDWAFPESARTLARRGAQVVAHPSNLVLPYCQGAMITRCIENRVHAATANRVGTEDRWTGTDAEPLTFTGRSQVADARGRRAAALPETGTGVAVASVLLADADDKQRTPWNHLWRDRRPEHYEGDAP